MVKQIFSRRAMTWLVPAAIVVAAVLLVIFGPEERALGAGIKIVYVHVALTWAGMTGLGVAAALGAGVILFDSRRSTLESKMLTTGRVATGVYTAGFIVSLAAEQINWGGIYWSEPRTISAMQITAVALIVQVVNAWLSGGIWYSRLRGLLSVALFGFVLLRGRVESLLHPDNAASDSGSPAIQLTFVALFALCCMGMAWAVWYLERE